MTSGEGGMDSCADEDLARRLRLLRNQGLERRYENDVIGFTARMTDVHAAIGRVQLGKLAGWTAQRRANSAFFDANLEGVTTPPVAQAPPTCITSTPSGCRMIAMDLPGHCRKSTRWEMGSTTQCPLTVYLRTLSRSTYRAPRKQRHRCCPSQCTRLSPPRIETGSCLL